MKTAKPNPKSKKAIIIVLLIIVAIVAIILIVAYNKNKKKSEDKVNGSTATADSSTLFPIKYGDQSEYVRTMQTWLVAQGAKLPVYGIDGIFGDETKAALKVITGKTEMDYDTYSQIING